MRIAVVLLAAAAVVACAPKEEAPADSAAPAAAPAVTMADFAGTWNNKVVLEGTPDTIPSTLHMDASGMAHMSLQGRDSIPLTVSMSGDSLVAVSAEYESILRKGVMVTVRTATVMHDGMQMGNVEATYKTPEGTQVVKGTMTATKAP